MTDAQYPPGSIESLLFQYTGGLRLPTAEQVGFLPRATDEPGGRRNVEWVDPAEIGELPAATREPIYEGPGYPPFIGDWVYEILDADPITTNWIDIPIRLNTSQYWIESIQIFHSTYPARVAVHRHKYLIHWSDVYDTDPVIQQNASPFVSPGAATLETATTNYVLRQPLTYDAAVEVLERKRHLYRIWSIP